MKLSQAMWMRLIAVVIVAAMVVLGVYAGCSTRQAATGQQQKTQTTKPGPIDGMYSVDYGRTTAIDGSGGVEGGQRTDTWVIRSTCRESGCVAAASVVNPNNPAAPAQTTRIFDQIGSRWVYTGREDQACEPSPGVKLQGTAWWWIVLEPKPDGTMSGTSSYVTTVGGCNSRQMITVHGAGDPDPKIHVPSPDGQPPRVVSPAAALHGQYTYTESYAPTHQVFEPDHMAADTECLRTGDACVTTMLAPNGSKIMVMTFADGRWTEVVSSPRDCSDGSGVAQQTTTRDFPLPDPPQDPIPLLTGQIKQDITGACAANFVLDAKFERTGD
jgi:hypothetical protein